MTIDLRANTPSTFLRPHAQHGLVIRKLKNDEVTGYDLLLERSDLFKDSICRMTY